MLRKLLLVMAVVSSFLLLTPSAKADGFYISPGGMGFFWGNDYWYPNKYIPPYYVDPLPHRWHRPPPPPRGYYHRSPHRHRFGRPPYRDWKRERHWRHPRY